MKKASPTITHISTVHPAFDVRIFHKQCKSLAKQGFNVNLVVTHSKEEVVDDVHIIPLPTFKGRLTRILVKPFLAFSRALKTQADLFHFHDPELIPMGLLLKILGKKVIYDVHEDVPSQILDKHWIPSPFRKFISGIFREIEDFSSRTFDGIVAATPYITNNFLKRNENAININNYPLIEELFDLKAAEGRKKTHEKIICYVGSITKKRGIFELIKALEGTDIKLYLAGTTSPKSLINVLQNEKGWKNVVYFGQVDRKKICSILSKSQVGICTLYPTKSYVESLPIKLFEYMSAGLPIVASNFPYWQDLLADFNGVYFVDPLNPEEIRKALNTIFSDCQKSHSLGGSGLKAIKECYNWDIEEAKLITFYKKLGITIEFSTSTFS